MQAVAYIVNRFLLGKQCSSGIEGLKFRLGSMFSVRRFGRPAFLAPVYSSRRFGQVLKLEYVKIGYGSLSSNITTAAL